MTGTTGNRAQDVQQARRFGLAVFAVQLVVLLVWSAVLAAHSVQSFNFVGFYHSWYAISHGDLNPPGWWQSQGVFIQWPLALLGLIWAHPVTLLLVQAVAIVGAETVAFLWICDLVAEREVPVRVFCLTGLALLVLNPWIYWSASMDYHSEPLGTFFAVLAARELFRGRRLAWLWCALTLLSGMIPATYLVGIGASLLFRRGRRLVGVAVAVVGVGWFRLIVGLGAGLGVGGAGFTGHVHAGSAGGAGLFLTRMTIALHTLSAHWLDAIANVAPSGLIGVFATPALGIAGVTLTENFSSGVTGFLVPSFQGLPLYVFGPIGTIVLLIWLSHKIKPAVAYALAGLAVANVIGWSIVWLPEVIPTWLNVSGPAASAVRQVNSMIPQQDAVEVSQGVAGAFASHRIVKQFFKAPTTFRLHSPYTWVVVTPYDGIEVATVGESDQLIETLAHDPAATLEYSDHNVWAFRLRVPSHPTQTFFQVPRPANEFSAALFNTYGKAVKHGQIRSWYLTGSDRAGGPILWGDRFLRRTGSYRAAVTIQGPGPALVEVRNDTTGRVVARRRVFVSSTARIALLATITKSDPLRSVAAARGQGPFQVDPILAYRGNYLEVVVYSTSSAKLKVKTVSVAPLAK